MTIQHMIKLVEVIEDEVKRIRQTNTAKDMKNVDNSLQLLKANLKRANRPGMNR